MSDADDDILSLARPIMLAAKGYGDRPSRSASVDRLLKKNFGNRDSQNGNSKTYVENYDTIDWSNGPKFEGRVTRPEDRKRFTDEIYNAASETDHARDEMIGGDIDYERLVRYDER